MKRDTFLDILMANDPEEINEYIAIKGKKKTVNAITFVNEKQEDAKDDKN